MKELQSITDGRVEVNQLQCDVCGNDIPNTDSPVRLAFETPASLLRNSDSCLMGMPGIGSANASVPMKKHEAMLDSICFRTHSKLLRLLEKTGLAEIHENTKC